MQGEGRRPNTGYNTVGFRVVAVNKSNSTSYNTENNNTNITRKVPTTNSQGKQFNPNGQNQKKRPDKKPPLKPGGNKTPANWN